MPATMAASHPSSTVGATLEMSDSVDSGADGVLNLTTNMMKQLSNPPSLLSVQLFTFTV